LLVFEQHLGQESPQGNRRGVHEVLVRGERGIFIVERFLNGFFRSRRAGIGKGQAGSLKKRSQNQAKSLWQGA